MNRLALRTGVEPVIPVCDFREPDTGIHIGLVNNMPGKALMATEWQFRELLAAAAGDLPVRLSLFALPGVPRSEEGLRHVDAAYAPIDDLWNTRLDGIIVTGTEPQSSDLTGEPYWESLARTVDWAEHNTHSAVWSCLAAHAAVLHIDGIRRRPLREKLSGVFECAKAADDPLMAGVASRWRVPHSRCNDLSEDALTACGYRVLARSPQAGVDAFVKRRKSTFIFFQGHLEYEADTLALEYRRDIRRFLRGERSSYPSMPHGYFDKETAALLAKVEERAISDLPMAIEAARVKNTWRTAAVTIYRNWLLCLAAHKQEALRSTGAHATF
jgi:homoserine O-succinyltransferase